MPFDPNAYPATPGPLRRPLLPSHKPAGSAGAPQIVQVIGPDGSVAFEAEFPADSTDAEIKAAINKHAPGIMKRDEAEMMRDLATADAAGDTELAQHIAGRIKAARASGASPKPGIAESGVRGALQGASFGFGDEAAAAIDAALPSFLRNKVSDEAVGGGATYGERYQNARDYYRNRNASAEKANPGTYLAGQLTGAVAAPGGSLGAGAKGARALVAPVAQGAAAGLGYSDADLTRGEVGDALTDVATGGALGVGGHYASKLVGGGLSRLAARGAQRESLAAARAGTQAAGDVAEGVQSAAGKVGGEVQKGSRYVENLMRLEAEMTPAQKALYSQLEAAGVVPNLQRAVAQSTLEALPGQASTIAARQAEFAALQAAAPQAVAERTQQLLTPQVRADAASLFKSYGEPAVAAFLGYKAADLAGADPSTQAGAAAVAGLLAGRTRAGKALRTRINRPAHQAAIGRVEQAIGDSRAARALVEALRRGVPALATDAAVNED
jgi:hypothetical protein